MRMRIDEVRKLCEDALVKKGFPKDDANLVVSEYMEGELQGHLTHGLLAFPSLAEGFSAPKEKWVVERESDSTIFVNGNGNFGVIVCKELMGSLCEKAEKEGMGFAAISNISTFLMPRSIARMVVERGMIGIVLINGGREMTVPEGGIDPVLGTNPIGVGIPTNQDPIVFDMATSKRAYGEVTVSRTFKRPLPEEAYLDKNGNFTTNPEEAYSVVSMGGYKGYALGLLFEILTGSLVKMPMGIRGTRGDYRRFYRGSVIIVIDPSFFGDPEEFKKRNSELVNQIKAARKAKGINEILVPGEKARKTREENLKNGYLEVNDELVDRIKKLSEV